MIWLLRIDVAGRTWYLASESCEPEQAGDPIAHHGTLTVSGFGEGIEIGGGVSGPCTMDCSFHLGEDGWALFRDGHRLDGSAAEVSLWRPGTTYAERYVLLTGRVDADGQIPLSGEPIEVTISAPLIENANTWPPASDVITTTAWPNVLADDEGTDLVGQPYPWPLGKLGDYIDEDGTAKFTSTTEVLIVDGTGAAEVGCVAGAPVGATTVSVWNSVDRNSHTFTVDTTIDGDGAPRATIDLSTAPGGWVLDGSEPLYVRSWGAGGLLSDFRDGPVVGLGDAILTLLLRRYGDDGPEVVDVGSWLAMSYVLNAWEVGLIVEAGVDPLDTITGDLLPLCPALWIVGGPAGFRPIYLGEVPGALCRRLEVGRDIFVSSEAPGLAAIQPLNSCTVSFAPSTAYQVYRGVTTADTTNHASANPSVTRHGARQETFETKATFDRGTAALMATESIRTRWTPPIFIVYDAPADVALELTLGERVRLVDPDRDLEDQTAWILSRETTDGENWTITVIGMW